MCIVIFYCVIFHCYIVYLLLVKDKIKFDRKKINFFNKDLLHFALISKFDITTWLANNYSTHIIPTHKTNMSGKQGTK